MNAILKDGTYHREIVLPASPEFAGKFGLVYSNHALGEAARDRYFKGALGQLPSVVKLTEDDPDRVEATFEGGQCVKLVIRVEFDDELDLVLVLIPAEEHSLRVKTLWFNQWDDKHATLDRSRYLSKI
jgi:hypothetical protein